MTIITHKHTQARTQTHTRRQWLVCEVIICACQVAGLEFITPHSGLISPDATASSPSLFLRWPPSLSRPDGGTKSILLLLISTDDRVAQVETTTLSFDATDLHPTLTLSVFMKLWGSLAMQNELCRRFLMMTVMMCLRHDSGVAMLLKKCAETLLLG